jgi:predicted DNA-binding transcriptional regulator YafY
MKEDSSTARSLHRRMFILKLLHARPTSRPTILVELDKKSLLGYDRVEEGTNFEKKCKETFHRDLKALRKLGYIIQHNPASGCYIWENSPFGLHLDDEQLGAFSVLLDAFNEPKMLHSEQINHLLSHLTRLLPPGQQKKVASQRRAFRLNLRQTTDYRNADRATLEIIERAIKRGQQLEFNYSPSRDGQVRQHVIEPRPLEYENGHVYLKGYSLRWEQEYAFRLDKIVAGSARMLPDTIARARPTPARLTLQYWLSPVIVRQGVSQHFDGQIIETHSDGSATVTAHIPKTELFNARQQMLKYGNNCRVLSPPELVSQIREVISELYKYYCKKEG